MLFDESCKSSGVAPALPEENFGQPDMEKLHDAIFRLRRPGTVGKQITGTFIGTYSWNRKKVPSRVLMLRRVEELRVEAEHEGTK